ncbi:unnamed protein product [Paramecium sonneborni]|uniref:Uncharacterized protein n=1 Tax=Paramecium sonneborni TaxID=65129 RepID=A0A8S1RT37_9CILI|nr:unnamed protein product [Paramecium sonneborni]
MKMEINVANGQNYTIFFQSYFVNMFICHYQVIKRGVYYLGKKDWNTFQRMGYVNLIIQCIQFQWEMDRVCVKIFKHQMNSLTKGNIIGKKYVNLDVAFRSTEKTTYEIQQLILQIMQGMRML